MSPGAKIPPKLSPKTQTTSPHPALTSPPSRDNLPRGATSSQTPIPTWIQTAEAGAAIGWLLQIVVAEFTRCCTHDGEDDAVGWITCVVMPRGIDACPWRMPSKIQTTPKQMRSNRHAGASGDVAMASVDEPSPEASARRSCAAAQHIPHEREEREDDEDDETLVQEQRLEGRDDRGVVRLESRTHPRHGALDLRGGLRVLDGDRRVRAARSIR